MKKNILCFILGLIVAGSFAGVVALNYSAKDVSYTPSDNNWNVNNVEDAIGDLYKKANDSLGTYKILETGTFTTINTGNSNHSYNTITLKNTYTEGQNAFMKIKRVLSTSSDHVAPYIRMDLNTQYIVGNTIRFAVVNYGTTPGTATFEYEIVQYQE